MRESMYCVAHLSEMRSIDMGFLPGLCLVFVIAKLAGWIAWSWWLVFAPVWIPAMIALVLYAIVGMVS